MKKYNDIENIVFEIVEEVINEISEEQINVNFDNDLFEIGLDSLGYMNIVVKLEDYFEVEFDDDILVMEKCNTIEKLCQIIREYIME